MLTESQHKTLHIIQDYVSHHGFSPTVSEIAEQLHVKSRGMIQRNLHALVRHDLIKLVPNRRRNIQLVEKQPQGLPLLGKIAAGMPIEAVSIPEIINIPELLIDSERYLLQVKGDSMIGDNICDGDLIVCQSAETAPNGTIVVALIDGEEATLKRIYNEPKKGMISLIPSNPALMPMIYEAHRVVIQGIYLGLLRLGQLRKLL